MAQQKTGPVSRFIRKPRRKRPGIHAKTKSSKNPRSKTHKKRYRGQGK